MSREPAASRPCCTRGRCSARPRHTSLLRLQVCRRAGGEAAYPAPAPACFSQVLVLRRRCGDRPLHVLVQPAHRLCRCAGWHVQAHHACAAWECRPLLASLIPPFTATRPHVCRPAAALTPPCRWRHWRHCPCSAPPCAADGPWKPWEPPAMALPDYCRSPELSELEREVVAYANHP